MSGVLTRDYQPLLAGQPSFAVADTALAFSSSAGRRVQPAVTDTALTFTSSVSRSFMQVRSVSDTALALTETPATTRTRQVADTALSFTSSVARQLVDTRSVTDTALNFSSSTVTTRLRPVTDTALSFSSSVSRTLGSTRLVSDTAIAFSSSVSRKLVAQRSITDTALVLVESPASTRTRSVTDDATIGQQSDQFSRTTSNGWGGNWTTGSGTAANFATNGSVATIGPLSGSGTAQTQFLARRYSDTVIDADMTWDSSATGGTQRMDIYARSQDGVGTNNGYRVRMQENSGATSPALRIEVFVGGVNTLLSSLNLGSFTPGDMWTVRFRLVGSALAAKAWKVGTAEPAWQVFAGDTNFANGQVGLGAAVASAQTNNPTISFDNATVETDIIGAPARRTVSDTALSLTTSVVATFTPGGGGGVTANAASVFVI